MHGLKMHKRSCKIMLVRNDDISSDLEEHLSDNTVVASREGGRGGAAAP